MKLFKLALVSGATLLAFAACDDTKSTGMTGMDDSCEDTETLILEIFSDCDGTNWEHWALTQGWTSDGAVNIDQTGVDPSVAWSEEHDLTSKDFGTDHETYGGCWDELEVILPITTDWEAQEANVNSLFECSDPRKSTLTWMIRVWDTDSVMSDCAVWGEDVAFYAEFGCADWT